MLIEALKIMERTKQTNMQESKGETRNILVVQIWIVMIVEMS